MLRSTKIKERLGKIIVTSMCMIVEVFLRINGPLSKSSTLKQNYNILQFSYKLFVSYKCECKTLMKRK